MTLFQGLSMSFAFPVPLPTGSFPPSVYAFVLGRPDHRPDAGFLEVSAADFLALPAQALPPFSSLGRAGSTLDCPSLSGSLRKLCGSSVINRLYFYLVPFRHVILWDRSDLWRGHEAHPTPPNSARNAFNNL